MKRLILTFALIVLLAFTGAARGAMDSDGNYTDQKLLRTDLDGVYIYQVMFICSGASGAFTSTVLDVPINGYILKAETIPAPFTSAVLDARATAKSWTQYSPTANYDVEINDTHGYDLFGGALANRSATASEMVRPLLSGTYGAIEAYSRVELQVSGNSVANGIAVIRLWYMIDE